MLVITMALTLLAGCGGRSVWRRRQAPGLQAVLLLLLRALREIMRARR